MRGGEAFGEIALFGGKRTATARALEDCALLVIHRADVLETLRHRPEPGAAEFIDLLCARLRDLSDKVTEHAFRPVSGRLASRLLYLDVKVGRDGQVAVSAIRLGPFRLRHAEGVAKVLAAWRGRNWIALSRGSVPRSSIARRSEQMSAASTIAGSPWNALADRILELIPLSCHNE